MKKREKIKTTKQEIVSCWRKLIDEDDLSVDWSEAETHCWRCGCENNLERCHIIPDALGGKDEPENLVLLCHRCHADGPNVLDKEIMWDWIKAYKVTFYETFWIMQGLKEYEFIYKRQLLEDVIKALDKPDFINNENEVNRKFKEILKDAYMEASRHFGQPYFNTATMAGIYRIAVKKLKKNYLKGN